ncbi:MAG: HAMP domain-containing histidine kinase [Tissierellales bacterium]|nr:HAMP domain-containing histidine kinase [Tissierellales bacterium]
MNSFEHLNLKRRASLLGKVKGIKFKWTVFILFLLLLNMFILGVFLLKGIHSHQKNTYENLLMENSKLSNLYIRERYISREDSVGINLGYGSASNADELKNMNFKEFYEKEAYSLSVAIEKMVHLQVALFDYEGELLDGSFKEPLLDRDRPLLKRALSDEIVYEKRGDEITYFAPVYDFENQVGAMKIVYIADLERVFYNEIKWLFVKIAIIALVISGGAGIWYFSGISRQILKLKSDMKSIESGKYDIEDIIKTDDEIEELSRGIYYAASKINSDVNALFDEKSKLELALEKLRKLERQQKAFIGDITHEFKTPLTVIKAQLDLMWLYKDDEELVVQAKAIAEKEIKRLDSMVAKTLYLSKLEKYDFEKQIESVDMKMLLEDICQRMEGKARKFGIKLNLDLIAWTFECDKDQMMQIVINLVDNAIKYNHVGGAIFIRTYEKSDLVYLEIEDTGIGIADEDKKHIFEPFYVVDKNRSKKFSGTGLGLALVKKLAKAQGLDIQVSDGENGTKMTLKNIDS